MEDTKVWAPSIFPSMLQSRTRIKRSRKEKYTLRYLGIFPYSNWTKLHTSKSDSHFDNFLTLGKLVHATAHAQWGRHINRTRLLIVPAHHSTQLLQVSANGHTGRLFDFKVPLIPNRRSRRPRSSTSTRTSHTRDNEYKSSRASKDSYMSWIRFKDAV